MTMLVFPIHSLEGDLFERAVEERNLSNFKQVLENGVTADCQSVMSTASPVDYTSMLTGMAPLNHGITDIQTNTFQGAPFWSVPDDEEGHEVIHPAELDETRLFTSYDVDFPWVWDHMEDHRAMQFGIFSPTTYPAPRLPNDGIWVSGYWTRPSTYLKDNVEACNNPDVRETLLESFPDYQINAPFAIPPIYPEDASSAQELLKGTLEKSIAISERTHNARLEVVAEQDADIVVTEDAITDNLQHLFFPLDEDNPLYDETVDTFLEEEDLLGRYFEHLDEVLGWYLEALPDVADVIIVSAHGQQPAVEEDYLHDQFNFLFKHGIWDIPEGWAFREERPSWSPVTRGVHSRKGYFAASGPSFRDTDERGQMSCMDITPLLLSLYGYSVPQYMDGRVPDQVLDDG